MPSESDQTPQPERSFGIFGAEADFVPVDKLRLNWMDVFNAVHSLHLKMQQSNYTPTTIVAVARGGLIPSVMLAHLFDISDLRVIRATSYDDTTQQQGSLQFINPVTGEQLEGAVIESLDRPDVVVIDDLLDSGATMIGINKLLPSAALACIFFKDRKQEADAPDDFLNWAPMSLEDKWVLFPWEYEGNAT